MIDSAKFKAHAKFVVLLVYICVGMVLPNAMAAWLKFFDKNLFIHSKLLHFQSYHANLDDISGTVTLVDALFFNCCLF